MRGVDQKSVIVDMLLTLYIKVLSLSKSERDEVISYLLGEQCDPVDEERQLFSRIVDDLWDEAHKE